MTRATIKLPSLTDEQVSDLLALQDELKMYRASGYTRRAGANTVNNLSQYNVNKIEMCPIAIRERFRAAVPKEYSSKAYTEYFLDLPAYTGQLDRMVYWLDKYTSMRMFSYALKDNQKILIDEEIGKVELTDTNVREYYGHTVWVKGKNAILTNENKDEWLGKSVSVRTPLVEHTLNKGEGISFVVNAVHEIKKSNDGQLWACIGAAPFL